MKSTLLNMTAVLFGITLVASAGVGFVNMMTVEPIAAAKEAGGPERGASGVRRHDDRGADHR